MADEGAFMELIIANERVGEWLDALSNTSFVSLRRRRAADALAKAVQESEAYQEEVRACIVQWAPGCIGM